MKKVSDLFNCLQKKKNETGCIDKSLLRKYLPNNPVIVEAGAHIGRDTVEMAKTWRKGKLFAFEPVDSLYGKLVANTRNCPNVICQKFALGNQTREGVINISGGTSNGSSSLLKPKEHLTFHPSVTFQKTQAVDIITLDDWAEAMKIQSIDFIWLDLQGMEMSVLQAAPRILKTVKMLYTEVSLIPLYENAPLYPEFKNWLASQGFFVNLELLAWKDAGNVLFLREQT